MNKNIPYVWREFNDIGGQRVRIVVTKKERINELKTQFSICVEMQGPNGMGEISWHPIKNHKDSIECFGAVLATLVEESGFAKEESDE